MNSGSHPSYWRMQLHPYVSQDATRLACESLTTGFIGLDFSVDIGDLFTVAKSSLPAKQKAYWAFAHSMAIGDWVLIMAHNHPLALCCVAGEYNYIRRTEPKLGVWFRHFRSVDQVTYFDDYFPKGSWEGIIMKGTIDPLKSPDSRSRQLIAEWLNE